MSRVIGYLKSTTILTACTLMLTSASVFAADVNLSGVEISKAETGYNILLKTDKKTTYKHSVKNADQLVIEMKNTAVSDDFSTMYNDVATINNVTVNPIGKEDLKIQIQGADVAQSKILLNYATTLPVQSFNENEINLNLPVSDYRPIYDKEELEETEEVSNPSIIEKLAPAAVIEKIKATETIKSAEAPVQTQSASKWLTYLGLFIIIATACSKLFKGSDNTAQIGLTQSLKERERELARKLNSEVKETLSLRNKVEHNTNAPSINYGLRSYQNSQRNPYESAAPTARVQRNTLTTSPVKSEEKLRTSPALRPYTQNVTAQPKTYTKPAATPARDFAATAPRVSSPTRPTQATNVDSMKFLESMTRIYEKSGRADLAMGLKNTIKKANI